MSQTTAAGDRADLPEAKFELHEVHPAALATWAGRDPAGVAVRYDRGGELVEWTRRHLAAECGRVAASLAEAGLGKGDRVGIVGPSSPWWMVAAEGTQAAGGVTVGAYPTSAPDQLAHVLGSSGARFVFAGTAELADRVRSIRDRLPALEAIIVPDDLDVHPDGTTAVRDLGPGAGLDDDAAVAHLAAATAALDPDDVCTIVYTSGTAGDPKGAVHSFRSLGMVADTVAPSMGYSPADEYIVHLPLNHTAEQAYTIVLGAQVGWTLNFARSAMTLAEDLVRFQPTVMFGVPRIFEKVREQIESAPDPDAVSLADFGFHRLWAAICGGAPLARDLVEFFAARGVKMCNTYGMTEANAIASAWDREPRGDTCGGPFPGVEVRLAVDGELLVRSHGLCLGYHGDEEATRELRDEQGFLRTGDIGEITEDGDVRVIDRKKDIIITSGGKNISPSPIEHALSKSELINRAVVVGDARKYLVVVIEVAVAALRTELVARGVEVDGGAEVVSLPEAAELIDAEVAGVNATLSRPEQVKRWAVLPEPLVAGDPALTPTHKVKRKIFEDRYAALIEDLYRAD